MATVRKLPSGKWNATAYYKDKLTGKIERPSFTAPTKSEALRLASEFEENKARAASPRDMSVGECIEKYITVKEAALSPATIRGYRKMQRNNFHAIENISIKNLADADAQLFVSTLCGELSPKTVRNVYALFSSAVGMFSGRQFRVTLPQKIPVEYAIPTDENVKLLMEKASPKLRLAIALAAIGTLREGEVSALRFRDVNHEAKTIRIHCDMVKNTDGKWIIKEAPKSSASTRIVPLPDEVMELIGDGEPDSFVVPIVPTTIYHNFARLRDKHGLKCRFHDLRHYAASIMHALGVPDQYIMERGGWKSDAVLKSVYRNTLSDQSAKFAKVANDHFSALF